VNTAEILLIAGVAIGLSFAAMLLVSGGPKRRVLMERLQAYQGPEVSDYTPHAKRGSALWSGFLGPLTERMGHRMQLKAFQSQIVEIQNQLEVAGNPAGMSPEGVVALMLLMAVAGTGLGLLLGFGYVGDPTQAMLLTVAFGGMGLYAPRMWLGRRVRERRQEILEAMPNSLDLLTLSVEAGLGFDAALQRVAEKYNNSLADEFNKVLAEMKLGRTRKDSLLAMGERVQVDEISSFVTAIVQSSELGASLADTLRVQAEDMRRRRRQRAEEKGNQAPLKMLFPMVGCIFPALFVVLLGPAVIQVAHQFTQK
jgi:tight adherence protein C